MSDSSFTSYERQGLSGLISVIMLRMIGLFLVVPVIALYARELTDATPQSIGLAFGVYGFTQALFQIPLGLLSDKYGRKPIIFCGLAIFALGSLLCAFSSNIWGLIFGRLLQGAGAISAAVMALLSDITRSSQRTKAMAIFGMSIGASFILAIILGPILTSFVGVQALFGCSFCFALIGMLILWKKVPNHRFQGEETYPMSFRAFWEVFIHPKLWRLNLSISVLHALLALTFVNVPSLLHEAFADFAWGSTWVYFPVVLGALLIALPVLILAEQRGRTKQVFLSSIAILFLSQLLFLEFSHTQWGLIVGLWVFFVAFNCLEAMLPSWISKVAPVQRKGLALGLFSSAQFFGVFWGGMLAGALIQWENGLSHQMVFYAGICLSLFWLLAVFQITAPSNVEAEVLAPNFHAG